MLNEEIAYIAGFFDGEGYTGIVERGWQNKNTTDRSRYYYAQVRVSNNDKKILEWIDSLFPGGKVYMQRKADPGHTIGWQWHLYGSGVDHFLQTILPYTKVKREEIENVLAFRTAKYTHDRFDFQKQCYDRNKELKARFKVS
jgi:hypothetical protein